MNNYCLFFFSFIKNYVKILINKNSNYNIIDHFSLILKRTIPNIPFKFDFMIYYR